MALRLGLSRDAIASRINLTLPANVNKDETKNIFKMIRSLAEVFGINTDGIDELFLQTNLHTATGQFLDDYINDLSDIGRKVGESDDTYRSRFYKNVFVYNGTRDGMKQIVYDVLGDYPVALNDKSRGAFYDSGEYYNSGDGGALYGGTDGQPYVGYIILPYRPTALQLEEICALVNIHKALGLVIYIKWRRYTDLSGYTYKEIAELVTGQPNVKVIGPDVPYGDSYDGLSYYDDSYSPSMFGDEDESGLNDYYVILGDRPIAGVLDELYETLAENLTIGDHITVVYEQ